MHAMQQLKSTNRKIQHSSARIPKQILQKYWIAGTVSFEALSSQHS